MTRVKELLNAYNLSPMAGNAVSINFLFDALFNPLFSNLMIFYILINKSSFGEIFLCYISAGAVRPYLKYTG